MVTGNDRGLAFNRIKMFNNCNILFIQMTLLASLFNVNLLLVTVGTSSM